MDLEKELKVKQVLRAMDNNKRNHFFCGDCIHSSDPKLEPGFYHCTLLETSALHAVGGRCRDGALFESRE